MMSRCSSQAMLQVFRRHVGGSQKKGGSLAGPKIRMIVIIISWGLYWGQLFLETRDLLEAHMI